MTDVDDGLANDLTMAVVRMTRQLRFRRPESTLTLSQLSALATLQKEGPLTPGALAARERVRPPSMTRIIGSLAELDLAVRSAHPDDRRQVLVTITDRGSELVELERQASRKWMQERLGSLDAEQRRLLAAAADLMLAIVDEP